MSKPFVWEVLTPLQAPGATLDYPFDVSSLTHDASGAVVDVITNVSATVQPSGSGELSIKGGPADQNLYLIGDTLTVWLQGGVAGRGSYLLRFVISLSSGRVFDTEVTVPMSSILAATPVAEPPSYGPSTATIWHP